MSDRATGDGRPGTSSASSELAQSMPRVIAIGYGLVFAGAVAFGVVLGIGIGNLHGWDWALAGAGVFAASLLFSYWISPTPRTAWIGARLQPVATTVVGGVLGLCGLVIVACGYLLALMAPFSPGLQTQEVGSPLFVHLLIIGFLIGVTFLLLFPLIEPKRRAWLVWNVTQGRPMAKSLYALGFGVIVSTSIALWDQMLLLLAKHDVVWFTRCCRKLARPRPSGCRWLI
jgi:hypothetical protein